MSLCLSLVSFFLSFSTSWTRRSSKAPLREAWPPEQQSGASSWKRKQQQRHRLLSPSPSPPTLPERGPAARGTTAEPSAPSPARSSSPPGTPRGTGKSPAGCCCQRSPRLFPLRMLPLLLRMPPPPRRRRAQSGRPLCPRRGAPPSRAPRRAACPSSCPPSRGRGRCRRGCEGARRRRR